MNYSKQIKKASLIAFEAHKEDHDKSGYPYFMHCMMVASGFEDENVICTGFLHDVIEDHGDVYTFEYLKEQGFNDDVISALKLLTHSNDVDYLDYIRKIKTNDIARQVKIADLKHNLDLRRKDGEKPRKYDLYLQALNMLECE